MRKLAIFVALFPLFASAGECPKSLERAALAEAASLRSWSAIHASFVRFRGCDDGAIADGYNESVTVMLADRWHQLKVLAMLIAGHPQFQGFVLRHITESVPAERLKRITHQAQTKCPEGYRELCDDIAYASMTANKSSERTGKQSGRTVRAFTVSARAGAENQTWPAVQRNR
jgi:hypothetical protein